MYNADVQLFWPTFTQITKMLQPAARFLDKNAENLISLKQRSPNPTVSWEVGRPIQFPLASKLYHFKTFWRPR